jgi:hypothetical protein
MSEIERIIEALTAPPPSAAEVVTIERGMVERALALLESYPDIAEGGPSLGQEVCVFDRHSRSRRLSLGRSTALARAKSIPASAKRMPRDACGSCAT